MSAHDILMAAAGTGDDKLYVEDVFSTYIYSGNNGSLTINNGIDVAGKGGMVWVKKRSQSSNNEIADTARGVSAVLGRALYTNTTGAQGSGDVTGFNSSGFNLSYNTGAGNGLGQTFASWTFRKAPKFFDVVTYTGNGAPSQTINHGLGVTPGMVVIKRTDSTSDWVVWHRSLTLANTAQGMVLNTTDAFGNQTGSSVWGSTSPMTASTFSVGASGPGTWNTNLNGGSYVAYLFAHDTTTDGLIQCGSVTTSGSSFSSVNLGWEPQFVLVKSSNYADGWKLLDTSRGLSFSTAQLLQPNDSAAEIAAGANYADVNATGFRLNGSVFGSNTYIYMAIRRGPMKTPTDGTKVFSPLTYTASTGTARTTGFPVDLQIKTTRAVGFGRYVTERLTGVQTTTTPTTLPYLLTNSASPQASTNTVTNNWGNTGYADASLFDGYSEIDWNFRRAPGFFDTVCYTGTGSAGFKIHGLKAVPEMIIVKLRSTTSSYAWQVYHKQLGASNAAYLNTTDPSVSSTVWNSQAPTEDRFYVGSGFEVNGTSANYIALLFATCPGVSKVGSYTGTGATQDINCGFTTGARFVLIKRTSSTGDWYVWDSARGITSSNDPYSLLNTATAETTSTNYINQLSTGFTINASAPAAINANGGSYIFLAVS